MHYEISDPEYHGADKNSNNTGELTATGEAIPWIGTQPPLTTSSYELCSDSTYALDASDFADPLKPSSWNTDLILVWRVFKQFVASSTSCFTVKSRHISPTNLLTPERQPRRRTSSQDSRSRPPYATTDSPFSISQSPISVPLQLNQLFPLRSSDTNVPSTARTRSLGRAISGMNQRRPHTILIMTSFPGTALPTPISHLGGPPYARPAKAPTTGMTLITRPDGQSEPSCGAPTKNVGSRNRPRALTK